MQAIETAHVVVAVMDAQDSVVEQDASLLGTVIEEGRALVIAINKWDNIAPEQRELIRGQIEQRLSFADFAPLHFISARHGSGVGELIATVRRVYAAAMRDMSTPRVDAGARGRRREPSAAAGERAAHQAALCPPGRAAIRR